ncbi:PREDICTED: uncharacterized protein LOC109223798 isoform X2 [Nicotiana attenuata]|uniref:Uncharacterized protein n=2 Tax=Nicotiana attenuata TaxID=49451 RepID=A0A1J6IWM8_NICAT|nr:PREDICTED: uncharacterized protein LOC109223798 isoform X2 [Nicotiana attenuata]XP_019243779.1 PREDICTED: uncharacterized protein LOC109223798 isoform X2 [Nicotiana attenuata]OIT04992.1 hypothetical protein A4A49_36794 [Nicotiana attenuata]
MQCASYLPGYYPPKDLNGSVTGNSWSLPHNDITWNGARGFYAFLPPFTVDQNVELVHQKEILKQTILKHEAIFRYQVNELHRVYRRQRELMDEIRRRKLVEDHLHLQASESKSFMSQLRSEISQKTEWPLVDLTSIEPSALHREMFQASSNSISGQIVQPGADLLTEQNLRKDWKKSSSISSASRKRTFDLELPAEEYVDIEDREQCVEESPVQGPNILISELQPQHSSKVNFVNPGDSLISNSTPRGTFLLFDLNEPIQTDETGCPNSALESNSDQDLSGTAHAECSTLKKEATGGDVSNLNSSDEVSSVERTRLQCNQTASSPPRFVDKSRNGTKTNKSLLVSPRKKIKEIPFAVQALPCFITNASLSKSPKSSVGNSGLTGKKSDLYNSSASSPTSGASGSCLMKCGDNDPTSGRTDAVKLSKIPDSMNSVKGMDLNFTPSADLSDDQFSAPTSNISHLNLPEGREREICEKSVLLDCILSPDSALKSRKTTTNSTTCLKEETLLSPDHSEATMTSVDRDLEAPVSPENKECSPPRGDSLDNPIGTSAQWSKRNRMSDYTGETDRAAAETLLFISSFAVKARSKTLTGEPSEASHDSLGWLADIATSLASNLENEVGSRSRARSSRPRRRKYQRVLQTEVLPAAASVPLHQLNEDLLTIGGLKLPANAASESGPCRKTLRKTSSRCRKWSHIGGRTTCSLLHPNSSNNKLGITERFWKGWGVTKGRQNGRRARSISTFS